MRWWRYLWASPNTLLGCVLAPLVYLCGGRIAVRAGVLEMHGGPLPWLLRTLTAVDGGADALTLGHVVIARDDRSLDLTRAHERRHVCQYETWGPAFIPAYAIASLWAVLSGCHAYYDNRFERQARAESR
jgi:hypothetical protein